MSKSSRTILYIVALLGGAGLMAGVLQVFGVPDKIAGVGAIVTLVGVLWWWWSPRSKPSAKSAAMAKSVSGQQGAPTRARYSWMEDPDDYRPLPSVPDLEKLPESVAKEYVRKHMLRIDAEEQVDRYISEENVLHGTQYTPQQREVLIQRECRQIASVRDQVELEIDELAAKRGRSQREHQQAVEAIENSTQFGRSLRFKKDHPFLSGLMGEENVDKLTGQGWWKG